MLEIHTDLLKQSVKTERKDKHLHEIKVSLYLGQNYIYPAYKSVQVAEFFLDNFFVTEKTLHFLAI